MPLQLEPLRFRDDETRVSFAGAVELLGQEAARHGDLRRLQSQEGLSQGVSSAHMLRL